MVGQNNDYAWGRKEQVQLENTSFKTQLPINYLRKSFKREPTLGFQHRAELEGVLPIAQSVPSLRNPLISK